MGDVISNATNDMKVPTKFAAHQSKATGSVDLYALNDLNGAIGHQRACLKRTRLAQRTQERLIIRRPPRCQISVLHSIRRSACTRNDSGNVKPVALAVFMFTINSNLVGCSIGMSPGFAPLKTLST